MDSDTSEQADSESLQVNYELGSLGETMEVFVEAGYHAGEVSTVDGAKDVTTEVTEDAERYRTSFVSESRSDNFLDDEDSEELRTNSVSEMEFVYVDSELYRTNFDRDYVYDYVEIDRADENYYYDDSLDADYYEEMKTMENLIQQNSDLYMTKFNDDVSPEYSEVSLYQDPTSIPETSLLRSESETLPYIEKSLTTEMTFFEDQTTGSFQLNNLFGLEKDPTAIPTAAETSGELDSTDFDGTNSTYASEREKMYIDMSKGEASISKSEMTYKIPQNNSVPKITKRVPVSVSAQTTTTSTISYSSTTTTSSPISTTSPNITTATSSTTTTLTTTSSTTSTTTTSTTAVTTTTTTTTTTSLIMTSSLSSLVTTKNRNNEIIKPGTLSNGHKLPRKMPLVDNNMNMTEDDVDNNMNMTEDDGPGADTVDKSVLIPLGHGLYTKFVLNKDTKLDLNFLNII